MTENVRNTTETPQAAFKAWLERADGTEIVFAEVVDEAAGMSYGDYFLLCRTRRDRGQAVMRASRYENCKFREVDSDQWDRFDQWFAAQGQTDEEVDRDAA